MFSWCARTASFSLYLFDKTKVRIGEGYISLNNVGVGETVKFQVGMHAAGMPASFGLAARPQGMGPPQAARKVSITGNASSRFQQGGLQSGRLST